MHPKTADPNPYIQKHPKNLNPNPKAENPNPEPYTSLNPTRVCCAGFSLKNEGALFPTTLVLIRRPPNQKGQKGTTSERSV